MYSALMVEHAKATKEIAANYDAIQDFAKGKTVAELEAVIAASEPGKPVDAISSSTLADTVGYLQVIVDAAKSTEFTSVGVVANSDNVVLVAGQGAPHGTKSFGDAVVALEDGKIVAANIDEFQYMAGTGVPNSDQKFGENYADAEKVLASKLVNNEQYSKNMADKAGSTVLLADNYKAIENFAVGKTAAELADFVAQQEAGKPVDAVTGSTLADTVGYLNLLAEVAAK